MLRHPFQLGNLVLPSNVFCAPLAGCSDLPFRRMLLPYRPGLMYCEMVKMDALVRHDSNTYRLLDYESTMHPIGAQLCGSKPHLARKCAKILEDLGFDVIDLNCGCPVDKVTKDGSGSGMLKTPHLIGEILSEIIAAVKLPVTVKIRAGWDEQSINAVDIVRIAEEAGAAAICIHGRTRAQGYTGAANWDYIKACKDAAKNIKVIGNGDIFTPKSARSIFEHTNCDAILLSRGTFGQPWLVDEIYKELSGVPCTPRKGKDYQAALLLHLEHIVSYQAERRAVLDMRRVGCWYLKKGKGARQLREALNRLKSIEEMRALIEGYAWDEIDFAQDASKEEALHGAESCC